MRVDPIYISNLVGSLDQAQANEQQLTAGAVERREHHFAEPESGGAGENVLLLNQIQQDDSFTAELKPGDGAVAGGGFGAGQRGHPS